MTMRNGPSADVDRRAGEIYRRIRRQRAADLAEVCRELGMDTDQAADADAKLTRLGLIRPREPGGSVVVPISPEIAIVAALSREQEQLDRYSAALDGLHHQVTELVEQFLPLGTPGSHDVELQLLTDRESVTAYLDTATALTRDEVLSMHAGPLLGAHALQEGYRRGRALRERGIRLRTIYPRMRMTGGHVARRVDELVGVGYDIRVADTLPVTAFTFDARRAVLATDPLDPNAGLIAIEGELLVRCLVRMFEYCWLHATDHRPALPVDEDASALSAQERAVVRMLATGLKDEKIARRLGVSVRTVSRIVGDLMRRLDADSRFQAGVRAAGSGWTD
ncbi:MAG TPA: helix-turn-helix transcriptional regulator [Pseudonocardiaceae bacterium]|jgi:DNA-binding CsgD family transcriptional regulator|nr:helix-turn-helix transcriptional regulator [Pseudonocardiaceae bacterium]